jgi:hypothetical protein
MPDHDGVQERTVFGTDVDRLSFDVRRGRKIGKVQLKCVDGIVEMRASIAEITAKRNGYAHPG